MNVLKDVIGGLAAPVLDFLKNRQETKSRERVRRLELDDAKHQRQLDLIKQGLLADMNWEMEFARQAESSWKDEYVLGVVSIPAILSFVHLSFLNGPKIVSEGFGALGVTPGWYQMMLVSVFLATFGIRFWRRFQSDT